MNLAPVSVASGSKCLPACNILFAFETYKYPREIILKYLKTTAAILLIAGLSGCGGGGGSDGAAAVPTGTDTAPVAAAPAAVPISLATPPSTATPVTAVPSTPDPFGPVAGSVPRLVTPQPGSTAAVGNGSEGVYEDFGGLTFVSGSGDISRQLIVGSVWGSLDITGRNWMFRPGTQKSFVNTEAVTGSGTFSPGISMDGSYSVAGGSPDAWGPLTYSSANALAVAQDSVAGKWVRIEAAGIGMSIDVDATGVFAGRTSGSQIGVCAVSGAMKLSQPLTSKNLYSLTMTAVNAAAAGETACALSARLYSGQSAIVQEAAGVFVANGYFPSISFLVHTGGGASLALGMRKH